jgi:hypothetical protein
VPAVREIPALSVPDVILVLAAMLMAVSTFEPVFASWTVTGPLLDVVARAMTYFVRATLLAGAYGSDVETVSTPG